MAKNQKIWFVVFGAIFLIPEILWSPLVNFYYELLRTGDVFPLCANFLTNSDNFAIWKLVLWVQFFSLLLASGVLAMSNSKKIIKFGGISILILLASATLLATLFHFGLG
jgi:hypothetical protein